MSTDIVISLSNFIIITFIKVKKLKILQMEHQPLCFPTKYRQSCLLGQAAKQKTDVPSFGNCCSYCRSAEDQNFEASSKEIDQNETNNV